MTESRRHWNQRYRDATLGTPSPFLTGLAGLLPPTGRTLDVAGGSGRHALWLAARGLDVTLVDVSDVGLDLARAEARHRGISLRTSRRDLELEGLPSGSWDVAVCFHYLHRPLFVPLIAALAPGGLLICEIATVRNLERHERPPRPYLVEEGELARLAGNLEIVIYEEDWVDDDRHCARLVGRRSAPLDGHDR